MILKPPQKTEHLKQLKVMQDRYFAISPTSSEAFGRELAGYLGEKSLPYYIDLADGTSHFDLYGLRLKYNDHYFQIDSLFLFAHFLLITEVKHVKGKLSINEAEQLVQIKNQEEKVYPHPLQQANLQKSQLMSLLQDVNFPPIPIHTLSVFTHPDANLAINHPDILPIQQLPFRMKQLSAEFTEPQLEMDQLLQLGKRLLGMHKERPITFLQPTKEVLRNIRRGVFCPKCRPKIMKRVHGNWICLECSYKDRKAHLSALIDYMYLFGPYITSKQLRWFLILDSKYTASRILKELQLPAFGNTKSRRFNLQPLLKCRK